MRCLRETRGGIAVYAALALPIFAVGSVTAVEIASVSADKAHFQSAVDAAALGAAGELAYSTPATTISRASSLVDAQLSAMAANWTTQTQAEAIMENNEPAGMKVKLTATRPSLFGNLVPLGGFVVHVEATAMGMNKMPLCVIGLNTPAVYPVNVDQGKITAGGCVVHSNKDLRINGASTIVTAMAEASGVIVGTPPANSRQSAPQITDPFATLVTAPPDWNACNLDVMIADLGLTVTLQPGVHCGKILARNSATLRLAPGIHYFRDELEIKSSARLEGTGATVVFGKNAFIDINHTDNVKWNLAGSTSGPLAGFVLVFERGRTQEFTIPAEIVQRLEGVVYAPTNTLTVDGAANAASASAWTVVVGQELKLANGADMVINSDYPNSNVPVPSGVGNKPAGANNRLVS